MSEFGSHQLTLIGQVHNGLIKLIQMLHQPLLKQKQLLYGVNVHMLRLLLEQLPILKLPDSLIQLGKMHCKQPPTEFALKLTSWRLVPMQQPNAMAVRLPFNFTVTKIAPPHGRELLEKNCSNHTVNFNCDLVTLSSHSKIMLEIQLRPHLPNLKTRL